MGLKRGYNQTEAGVIPNDWETVSLRELFTLKSGVAFSSKYFSDTGPILLTPGNFNIDGGLYFNEQNTKRYSGPYSSSTIFEYKDLLIVMTDLTPGCKLLGKPAFVDRHEPILHNQRIGKIVPTTRRVLLDYLYWFFLSDTYATRMRETATGSTVRHTSNGSVYGSIIALPPTRAEQEAIVEALSDADALIESLEQLLTKKRHLQQGAMQELLTGKKRLPGFTGEWSMYRLGDVIVFCSSGATPYRGRPDFYKGPVRWITSGELNFNVIEDTIEHISEEAVLKTNLRVHPAGTFLMAITGLEAAGTRGACGIVGKPATTNQSCMAIYPTPALKTEYLYHYYVYRGNQLAFEYCQGTKQQSYTAKLVKLLPIYLPPSTEEQAAIAAVLSDMDDEIAALEAKLSKARLLKQGMMQELLTGRIRLV